jgi:hypothetical protein
MWWLGVTAISGLGTGSIFRAIELVQVVAEVLRILSVFLVIT